MRKGAVWEGWWFYIRLCVEVVLFLVEEEDTNNEGCLVKLPDDDEFEALSKLAVALCCLGGLFVNLFLLSLLISSMMIVRIQHQN